MWHTMPGTCGSSKTLTHTLSFGESALNVVLTQPKSVARAELIDITTSAATKKIDFIRKSPLRHSINSRAGYPFVCRTICNTTQDSALIRPNRGTRRWHLSRIYQSQSQAATYLSRDFP